MVTSVHPGGEDMGKALTELLASKDDVHYGVALVSDSKAISMIRRAHTIVDLARRVVLA